MSNPRSKQLGFTAIELLITVTVFAIIVSFAIPQFMESKKRANETAAISSLRAISSAQSLHRQRFGSYGTIAQLQSSKLIDQTFAEPRNGFVFTDDSSPDAILWSITSEPEVPGTTGDRFFFIDETGVIRTEDGAAANAGSNPIDL